jgi:hypothetical protein
MPIVHWYWGATGSGKSRLASELAGVDAYWKPQGKWWDGYTGQSNVILDDFRADWFSYGYMLRLLDRYPLKVEVKGSYVEFVATHIYITSHMNPTECFATWEDVAQLLRRLHTVREFVV